MALFNYANREITAKLVYYGPGMCGKTTSLQYIHERIAPAQRGRLLSLATETDRTIFFDLLPLKLGEIRGFKLRFQLYTVPGQPKYNKTRKLVLQGADAIVFVADSQKSRQQDNVESFQNLRDNLKEQGKNVEEIPLVYSYNKRDLEDLLSIEELNRNLNSRKLPHFSSIATQGGGVMETLEAISKLALQDIENRLTAGATVGPSENAVEEFSMTDEELVDLTSGEEPSESSLTFSSDELEALDFELESDGKTLETRPIGYDNNIPIEEVEIREEDVAHTGTLKESEFFNLKEIEEQALRELDQFIEGNLDDEDFSFDSVEEPSEPSTSEQTEEATLEEATLEFSLVDNPDAEKSERFDEDNLDFSFSAEVPEQPFELGGEESEETSGPLSLESDGMLDFSLDEETKESVAEQQPQESSAKGDIESLELSESELDMALGEEGAEETATLPSFDLSEEDVGGESTPLTTDDNELLEFTLDEDSQELDSGQIPVESLAEGEVKPFELSESELDLSLGEEEPEDQKPLASEEEPSEDQSSEPFDFRITDSVRFEMQHSEEISSVTPFEKQLDELSDEMFTSEEEVLSDTFQPETAKVTKEETFQTISDENTRLLVTAKYFYQRGEDYRAKQTIQNNILAIFMYYTAIETELKAVALKYDTCDTTIASLKIILDSIEEETGKTISGRKSIIDNIMEVRNDVQLKTLYPDDEACELAARICERFLTTLSQEFLAVDFTELSPVLAKPADE
jgi:signal recognition particle receptor subunit beta